MKELQQAIEGLASDLARDTETVRGLAERVGARVTKLRDAFGRLEARVQATRKILDAWEHDTQTLDRAREALAKIREAIR